MPLSDIFDMARLQIRDTMYPYRWSNETFTRYFNDFVKDLRRLRPDVRISSSGGDIPYSDLLLDGAFTFINSDTHNPQYVKNFDQIQGWRYNTWPTLYFYATTSNNIGIYASAADMAAQVDALATFDGSAIGNRTITMGTRRGELSGIGNTIYVSAVIPSAASWTVTVVNPTIIIDSVLYDEAGAYFICSECLSSEGEDTYNQGRENQFAAEYHKQIGV